MARLFAYFTCTEYRAHHFPNAQIASYVITRTGILEYVKTEAGLKEYRDTQRVWKQKLDKEEADELECLRKIQKAKILRDEIDLCRKKIDMFERRRNNSMMQLLIKEYALKGGKKMVEDSWDIQPLRAGQV